MGLKEPEKDGRLDMCKAVEDIMEMGRKEERKKWLEEGRKKVFEEGLDEGRSKKAFEDAINALRLKIKQSDVCTITGLSQAQVAQLASEMGL